ncbi:Fur family transcriptional regulator [Porphyromonas loveana]|uniref:Fur family transcriptional regulator n=1 Tax=Porphyromonas loveana TaxID=1884669 RepID=UPI0035A036B1
MTATPLEELRNKLRTYVSENGLRHTQERYRILDIAYNARRVFTPEVLYELAQEEGLQVSRATVYNTLTLFERSGIVLRLPSPGTMYQYLMTFQAEQSPLLFCTQCAEFSTYYRKSVKTILAEKELRPPRFTHEHAIICLYGICNKCKKSAEAQKRAIEREKAKKKKK